MKGILAEPGKAPVIASLPDSLWAIENRLGTPCEMIVLPRTPAVLFFRTTALLLRAAALLLFQQPFAFEPYFIVISYKPVINSPSVPF